MPFLKLAKLRSCPKCKNAKIPYGQKHTCNPARDKEVAPEDRPEQHHRKDAVLLQGRRFGTDMAKKQESTSQQPVRNLGGTPTVNPLIPKVEPERKGSYMQTSNKQRSSKVPQQETAYPETETRYESSADVRSMDATKDFPHAYREEGYRYGSPCSYDNLDDESKP